MRSLAVIVACLVGGVIGALLHGALYAKHGWFSGFGFAFGAVTLGLIASIVVDFALPLLGIGLGPAAPAATPPARPEGAEPLPAPQHYAATIFSLRLLIAFLGAAAAMTLVWALVTLAGLVIDVPRALALVTGLVAAVGGIAAGWRVGLALARALDLTVE
jgi:hypothetical protein